MAKIKKLSIQADFLLDLAEYLQGLELVYVNLSQSGHIFVLTAKKPLDYRQVVNNASFAKAHPDNPNDFVVFEFAQGQPIKIVEIPNQSWNYHSAQPLPDNELLLVCGRIHGETNNARVFDTKGMLKAGFYLRRWDWARSNYTQWQIWVGYFDEGVYSNSPLSQSGINCFDHFGNRLYAHADGSMGDCYALNVVSNSEVWSCYYTDFPLVQIQNHKVKHTWNSPVRGSHNFVVWKNFVLFCGGYKKIDEDDFSSLKGYQLLEVIPNQIIKELATVEVLIPQESEPGNCWILTRGSKMLLVTEQQKCYEIDLRDVVNFDLN